MKELIAFYTTHDEPLSSTGDKLLQPVSKYDKWTVQYRDINVDESKAVGESGHFGEALYKLTGEKVTVKTYAGDSPESINEFLLEVEVLKRCYNPNIIQ